MKKLLLFPCLFGAALLVACHSNDEESYADAVAGTYSGYTEAVCAYFSQTDGGQTVELTAVGGNAVNVDYESDTWGTFAVANASVTKVNGGYAITGEGATVMGMNGQANSYQCEFSGTVAGGTPEFKFTVPAVMGGLTVTFHPGEAPVGEETE